MSKKLGDSNVILRDPVSLGKMPPQAADLEEAVIGACILEKPAYSKVADIIDANDFYEPSHVEIFQAIIDLSNSHNQIDLLLVTNKLRSKGKLELVGGAYAITNLTSKVNSAEHIEQHALIIKQKSLQRKLIDLSQDISARAFEDTEDPFELLDDINSRLSAVHKFTGASKIKTFKELVHKELTDIDRVKAGEKTVMGVPTGYFNLDKILGYFVNSDLIILAARPGMGKSALAVGLCKRQAKLFKTPSALISLEMSDQSNVQRILSSESEISLSTIRFRSFKDHQYEQLYHKTSGAEEWDIYIIDDCRSLQQIRTKCRRLVEDHGVKLIVIDYLQLIVAGLIEGKKNSTRENEISYISREIKALAKELDVPIIALSQLSRAVEQRTGDKRPKLSDLRESGSIEQDADVVIFLYRPEYYGIKEDEHGEALRHGYTEAIIAKHRNGKLDMAELLFVEKITDFVNYDRNSLDEKIKKPPF